MNPVARAHAATFAGAFLTTLIYSTKPDGDPAVTLARAGSMAVVVDTTGDSLHTAGLPVDTAGPGSLPVTARDAALATPGTLAADVAALRAQSLVVPVAGVDARNLIDSFDDMRGGSRRHNALDIMAARNTPAVAATSGTIVKLHSSPAGGLSIYMADGSSRYMMMYGHLDSYRPGLREGAAVRRGEIIGFVGTTGNASPLAPHLHFQVMRSDNPKEWWKGTPLNPFLILRP